MFEDTLAQTEFDLIKKEDLHQYIQILKNKIKELESKPSCSKLQREFLDEVIEKGNFDLFNHGFGIEYEFGSFLDQTDFNTDLAKLHLGE